MKKLMLVATLIAGTYLWLNEPNHPVGSAAVDQPSLAGPSFLTQADSNRQVQGEGVVVKVLPDDNKGSRHQRFIIELRSGQRVLMAHNIDLAPRVPAIAPGDTIEFSGEYEWNERGGVVHWTHHDPRGRHESGWLRVAGRTYQ